MICSRERSRTIRCNSRILRRVAGGHWRWDGNLKPHSQTPPPQSCTPPPGDSANNPWDGPPVRPCSALGTTRTNQPSSKKFGEEVRAGTRPWVEIGGQAGVLLHRGRPGGAGPTAGGGWEYDV